MKKLILTFVFTVALVVKSSSSAETVGLFWTKQTDRAIVSAAAKEYTFFLRLVIGGSWGPETATYEITYTGSPSDLDLGRGKDVAGLIVRRDPVGEVRTVLSTYDLAHLVRDCIRAEFFELGPAKTKVIAPDVLKMDGCDLWVFIKYGSAENCFTRTDESIPVSQIYSRLKQAVRPDAAPPEPAPSGDRGSP